MAKAKKIEKVIKVLIGDIEMERHHVRQWKHRYDDQKASGANDKMLRLYQNDIDEHVRKVKELETLIDFMQELYYEEVK